MLFDLDGVLVDSETQYSKFWDGINKLYPTGHEDLSAIIKGTTLVHILDKYFKPETHSDIISRLDDFEHWMTYDIKPGVISLLTRLGELGTPAVMVTSSNDDKMAQLWSQQPELRNYFTHIVTADMISHSKPDPEGYLLGARLAGASPCNCAVFEDARQGVMAGKASGAYVVGIAGTLPADALFPYSDIVVDTLAGFNVDALELLLRERS